MKIIRFKYKEKEQWGVIKDEHVCVLKNGPFVRFEYLKTKIPLKKVKLLAPAVPSKIILVGLNYKNHAKELSMKIPQEPIIFLKPPTAIIGPNDSIVYPRSVKRLDYEAELALVIKKKASYIKAKDVEKYILGYTILCMEDDLL